MRGSHLLNRVETLEGRLRRYELDATWHLVSYALNAMTYMVSCPDWASPKAAPVRRDVVACVAALERAFSKERLEASDGLIRKLDGVMAMGQAYLVGTLTEALNEARALRALVEQLEREAAA